MNNNKLDLSSPTERVPVAYYTSKFSRNQSLATPKLPNSNKQINTRNRINSRDEDNLIVSLYPTLQENISIDDPRIIGSPPSQKLKYTPQGQNNNLSFSQMNKALHEKVEKENRKKSGDGGKHRSIEFESFSFNNSNSEQSGNDLFQSQMRVEHKRTTENHILEEEKITPRVRWQKAIRRVLILNKFSGLNKEIKVENTLFGRAKTNNRKDNSGSRCLILPSSTFRMLWSITMILALAFTAIYVPIRLAFLEEVSLALVTIEYLIDIIFFFDIMFNFFTAYYDSDHNLITDNRQIAKNYLKGWFIVDALACIPVNLIDPQNEGSPVSLARLLKLGRLYRIVKIFRLIRILKVIKGSRMYEKFLLAMKMNAGIKRLIKTIITFFIFMHFFACAWFYQARFSNFQPDSWVVRYAIKDLSAGHQYLISFYWVTTLSSIGYGDIIPYTKNERILAIIFMIIGVGFVSYAIGSLSSIMLSSDSKTQNLKKKLLTLDELALHLNINSELYYQIKRIIRNNHETNFYSGGMKHDALMEELPSSLKNQLLSLIFKKNNLGTIAFFHGKSPYFINEILPLLKRITLEKDEPIYRYGEYIDEMYFILKGTVQLVSNDHFVLSTYGEGSYFGEADILGNANFRGESAIPSEKCELVTLQKSDLTTLFEHNEGIEDEMRNIMKIRKERNKISLNNAKVSNKRVGDHIIDRLKSRTSSIFTQGFSSAALVAGINSGFKPNLDYEFPRNNSSESVSGSSNSNSNTDSESVSRKSNKSSKLKESKEEKNTFKPSTKKKNKSNLNFEEKNMNYPISEIPEIEEEVKVGKILSIQSKPRVDIDSSFCSYRENTYMSEERNNESKKFESYDFNPHQCDLSPSHTFPLSDLKKFKKKKKISKKSKQSRQSRCSSEYSNENLRRIWERKVSNGSIHSNYLLNEYIDLHKSPETPKREILKYKQVLGKENPNTDVNMSTMLMEIRKLQTMNNRTVKGNMKIWDSLRKEIECVAENQKEYNRQRGTPKSGHVRRSFLECLPIPDLRPSLSYHTHKKNIFL